MSEVVVFLCTFCAFLIITLVCRMDKTKKELRVTVPVRPPLAVTDEEILSGAGEKKVEALGAKGGVEGKSNGEAKVEARPEEEGEEGEQGELKGKAAAAASRARLEAIRAAKLAEVIFAPGHAAFVTFTLWIGPGRSTSWARSLKVASAEGLWRLNFDILSTRNE